MNGPDGREGPFRLAHAALIVDSDEALRQRLVPLLQAYLTAGEPVLIVVGQHTERVIRTALGDRADGLHWGDRGVFRQRPGLGYEGFRRYLQEQQDAGRSVHVIAEPDAGTNPDAPVDRVAAYLTYESVCNEAYTAYGCPVTCLWDSRRHSAMVIESVRSLHDHELTDIAMPSPPESVDVEVQLSNLDDVEAARSAVWAWSLEHGFSEQAAYDVIIATSEVVTNGLVHGSPPVRLRGWRHGDTLVVQVDDAGGRPIPSAAGYRRPDDPAPRGRGLWLARQLAAVVATHTTTGRTSVRLFFPRAVTHGSSTSPQ